MPGTERKEINFPEAVGFAWTAYRSHWPLFAGVLGAMLGAWVVLEIVVIATQRLGIVAWALAHIAFLLGFAGMEVGLLRTTLAIQDAHDPTLADTFKQFNLGPRFLAGQLLYLATVLAGLALLIVPGVWLAARFAFFGFPIAAGDSGVLRSFKQSAELTRGATGEVATTLVALVVLNLLGAALLGLGLFVTVPFSLLTMASIYGRLNAGAGLVEG